MNKWKISSLISLLFIAVIGMFIALVLLPSSEAKQVLNPLEAIKPGELIAKSDKNKAQERSLSLSPQDSLKTVEQAAEIVKKRFEEIRTHKIILADKETLISLLPELQGWQMENPQHHKGGYGGKETSNLSVQYTGPDSSVIQVEVIDYGAVPAALQPLKMIFKMERDDEAEKRNGKVSTYEGHFVLEEYNGRAKQRQFSSIINDRYQIKITCKGKNSQEILQNFTKELFTQKRSGTSPD